MCGRYALSLRPSHVRSRLVEQNMPVEEAPDDDDGSVRPSYNFAPGYHGLIYRADTPDYGAGGHPNEARDNDSAEPSPKKAKLAHDSDMPRVDGRVTHEVKYKLQAAKWGLVPFWTKRAPDYSSQLRTINCRDDSLLENRGMWNTMKQRKRCIVVCEGFYEWLKKNNGKEKIPHFTKRKNGQLMCFAGLWDCVKYEGQEEKLYSYTVITTDSNAQLKFLHDRMPVILEPGSEEMRAWLDSSTVGWTKELQSMLKPYKGELECFPVDKAVGKVGNNSPSFVVPIDSKENKKNIANFFGTQKATAKDVAVKNAAVEKEKEVEKDGAPVKKEPDENRVTDTRLESTEDNAPLPRPKDEPVVDSREQGIKRKFSEVADQELLKAEASPDKRIKTDLTDDELIKAEKSATSPAKLMKPSSSPEKKAQSGKRTRSATSNGTVAKTPTKEGNARITSFFGK